MGSARGHDLIGAHTVDELTYLSANALTRLIRLKELSAREVVEAHLGRIEEVNPKLNAVAQLAVETALKEAAEADRASTRGNILGPLHGLPFTVKDWIETEGVICAAGSLERKEFVPRRDATVVARMRAAGGIMVAKTIDGHDNAVYGHPSNPYDLTAAPAAAAAARRRSSQPAARRWDWAATPAAVLAIQLTAAGSPG